MQKIKALVISVGFFCACLGAFSNASLSTLKAKDTSAVPAIPQDISPLLIGEQIPAIKLPDADGKLIDLNSMIASTPSIVVFYRGGWCPYCNKHLSGLQEIEPSLKKMGYQVIAISTDSPEKLKETMTKDKLSYTLLSDADLTLAKQFGIAFRAPEAYHKMLPVTSGGKNVDKLLPVPSVFIVSKKGVIRFEHIDPNFKERLSPELLISVATSLYPTL